jgi:hypothetical protein
MASVMEQLRTGFPLQEMSSVIMHVTDGMRRVVVAEWSEGRKQWEPTPEGCALVEGTLEPLPTQTPKTKLGLPKK